MRLPSPAPTIGTTRSTLRSAAHSTAAGPAIRPGCRYGEPRPTHAALILRVTLITASEVTEFEQRHDCLT